MSVTLARSANGRTGYNFSAILALVISECSVGEKCQRPPPKISHEAVIGIILTALRGTITYRYSGGKGGSEKCDSSLDDNSFGDGNSEDPQQYVEGQNAFWRF